MNVLWLNAGLLLPLDKGGKLRTWHLMRHLATRHEITWLSYMDPDACAADLAGMSDVAAHVHAIPRPSAPKGSVRFMGRAARHLVSRLPYAVGAYATRSYRDRVATLLASQRFDLILCDFLMPAPNLPDRLPCPAVLFTHNVESEIWRRHVETAEAGWKRTLLVQQWQRMLRFEKQAVRRFDLVLAVSETDRDTLQRHYGPLRAPIAVVPTGVDTTYFAPVPSAGRPAHLVFTGSMDWLPNEDGVLFFAREILPRIRQRVPAVTVSIVGRDPTPAVVRLGAGQGIEVTGRVEDVRPHMAAAAVYIVPLRVGGGTRLKIFEAMSMGKPVVSTTVGAEGLPVRHGEHVLVADEPQAFADAVVQLLGDAAAREQLGHRARELVVTRYDWSAAALDLERALAAAAAASPERSHEHVPTPGLQPQTSRGNVS